MMEFQALSIFLLSTYTGVFSHVGEMIDDSAYILNHSIRIQSSGGKYRESPKIVPRTS